MLSIDENSERIVKEYIEGPTIFDMVRDEISVEPYITQVREMADAAKKAGLNIDYFPTNFVVKDNLPDIHLVIHTPPPTLGFLFATVRPIRFWTRCNYIRVHMPM
jgi:hypothetical protein